MTEKKKCFVTSLSKPPSESPNDNDKFCSNLNLLLLNNLNTAFSIKIVHSNAKTSKQWSSDKETSKSREIHSIKTSIGSTQLIDRPNYQYLLLQGFDFCIKFERNLLCGVQFIHSISSNLILMFWDLHFKISLPHLTNCRCETIKKTVLDVIGAVFPMLTETSFFKELL